MPYPNEHACRISQPLPQNSGIFARKSIAPGINMILQRPKSGGSMKTQSYRFSKHQFIVEEAKKWLKSHNISYISFEPASTKKQEGINKIIKGLSDFLIEGRGFGQGMGGDRQGDGGTDTCVCPKCGAEAKHNRGTPCVEMKCLKCGASMVGKQE